MDRLTMDDGRYTGTYHQSGWRNQNITRGPHHSRSSPDVGRVGLLTSTFLGREILEVLAVKLDPSNQSISHLADCWCLMFFLFSWFDDWKSYHSIHMMFSYVLFFCGSMFPQFFRIIKVASWDGRSPAPPNGWLKPCPIAHRIHVWYIC